MIKIKKKMHPKINTYDKNYRKQMNRQRNAARKHTRGK